MSRHSTHILHGEYSTSLIQTSLQWTKIKLNEASVTLLVSYYQYNVNCPFKGLTVCFHLSTLMPTSSVWTTSAFYLKHFHAFTNPSQQNLDRESLTSWKQKWEELIETSEHLLYLIHCAITSDSCIMRNGDKRRLSWTKSNFSKVLFRLQPEQTPWQILHTETHSGYSELQLAAGPRPKTWSVFILTAGRTIITAKPKTASLWRIPRETCYCHTHVSKLCFVDTLRRWEKY